MDRTYRRWIALVMVFALCFQMLTGCGRSSPETGGNDGNIKEQIVAEQYVSEDYISEEKLTEAYIVENLIYEEGVYEYKINENIISQAYIIEIVVGETTEEEIQAQLPEEIQDYDIDWPKVIGKFAVGTSIIVAVGIVNHFSAGSTYFVFGSPVKVARDALIGGAIGATLREVIGCVKDGKEISKSAKKYAIEGFADGYMWGAISSVLKINAQNMKRLKAFKLATGGSATIKPDGTVFNEAGQRIGRAFYDSKNVWHLLDDAGKTVQLFDSAGKQLVSAAGVTLAENSLPANAVLRLGTAADAVMCHTDDLGQIIMQNNELLPNLCYHLGGHTYYTDEYGRIIKVVFDELKLKPNRPRLDILNSMLEIGKGDALPGDQRGHLIADRFDGNNTLANIVPMTANANQGEVAALENIWAECLNNGGHVSGSIEISYSGTSFRPDEFAYLYDIGKGLVKTLISNL